MKTSLFTYLSPNGNVEDIVAGVFSGTVVILVILVVLFLILRTFFTWYWKITERVNLQKKQISILEKILVNLERKSQSHDKPKATITTSTKKNNKINSKKQQENKELIANIMIKKQEGYKKKEFKNKIGKPKAGLKE